MIDSDQGTSGPVWRVEMLGTFQVRSHSQVVGRFRTRRVGVLLAYLAYHAGQSHDRAELGELLWPEGDPDKMSANLRQALASLRRQIETPPLPIGSVVRSQNSTLSMSSTTVETDVAEFERGLTAARRETDRVERCRSLERVVALYRGELLPGYTEEWVLRERARLEDLYVHALRALAECAEAEGSSERAVDALHRALAKEPYDEALHARLIRLHLDAGQATKALDHYKEVEKRLADELGVRPDEPLRALAREARRISPERPASKVLLSSAVIPPPAAVSLPTQLTRLFGRQAETTLLVDEFLREGASFVTILGPAGAGKTTQATLVARRLAEDHGWQVGLVPMADYGDASMVLEGTADAMRASREHPGTLIERIRSAMTSERHLIVLDNAEHILESLVPIVGSLRTEISELRLIVTSRQSLKIADEREFVLDLLDIPPGEEDRPDRLALVPSVALFVDRARSVQPDFGLTPRNARAVAEICGRLDGLPLAIELAAGLSGAFTPSQMLGHLEHRLTILKTRRRDAPMRHRSLRVALDYSYDTLTEEQRPFFTRLSVFSGGFTLSAASQVALDSADEALALRLLLDLQERSLVFAERSEVEESPPHFRLLESFRQYGRERLDGAEWIENQTRHAEYFVSVIPPNVDALSAASLRRFRMSVLQDRGNYETAVAYLLDQGRVDDAVTILSTTTPFCPLGKPRGNEYEALRSIDFACLSLRSAALATRMVGIYKVGEMADDAFETLERAVELARKLDDPVVLVRCLSSLAGAASKRLGMEAALEIYAQIQQYETIPGIEKVVAYSYNGTGTCLWSLGRLKEAEAAFRKGLRLSREEPGEESNWLARYNLARVSLDQGRYDVAISLAGDAARIARRLQDPFGLSLATGLMARYRWKLGDLEGALVSGREAMTLRRNLGHVFWLANAIRFCGTLFADQGDSERAATLLAATERHTSDRLGEIAENASAIEKIKAALSPVAFRRAWERGLTIDLDGAYQIAL